MSKKSVFCIAASHKQADQIGGLLKVAGFADTDISVLFPDEGVLEILPTRFTRKPPKEPSLVELSVGRWGGLLALVPWRFRASGRTLPPGQF